MVSMVRCRLCPDRHFVPQEEAVPYRFAGRTIETLYLCPRVKQRIDNYQMAVRLVYGR